MGPPESDRSRVEQAVETLASYQRAPFLEDFIRQQPPPTIPLKYDKNELCGIIKSILLGEAEPKFQKHSIELSSLVAYLDRLQETGRQHIYLFRLTDEQLAALRDRNSVRARIGGDDAIYDGGILEWDAREGPKLVQVRHDAQTLMLKWVETREYWTGHEEQDVSEDRRVTVRERHEERALNFFVVNLANGECELRIQAIHGEAQAARIKQRDRYRLLIARYLGVEPVGPDVLAPAIRRILTERQVEIAYCEAILPTGGRFTGRHDELPPVDIRKLQAGITIAIDWTPAVGGVTRIELDGRLDELFMRRPFVSEEHQLLLDRVRRWRRDGIAVEKIAEETPEQPQTGIDRAIREYVQTHPSVIADDDFRMREQFLDHIREVAHAERQQYETEITLVQSDERRGSMLFLIAITLALLLFTIGAFLIVFFPKMITLGTVSALLSLLSGGATALLRWYLNNLKVKRQSIEERQRDSRDTALMIQVAMSHADQRRRSTDISRVTLLLMERVTRTPSASEPKIPIRRRRVATTQSQSASPSDAALGIGEEANIPPDS